jgi:gliding motility-associated-like protein
MTATKKVDLIKTVDSIASLPDGNYMVKFKIKVINRMGYDIDSLIIQDDLDKVFGSTTAYKVLDLNASGALIKNDLFNGSGVIDLVTLSSTLAAGKSDSILLSVMVTPGATGGQFSNVAKLNAKSPFGDITLSSDDPSINPADTSGITNRDATLFIIPAADVIIPGGFSPNNDGKDDYFVITHPIDSKVRLAVFNRWGNPIFTSDEYDNKWDGRGVKSALGDYVVPGTYYYVVTVMFANGESKKFAGPLTIVR